MPRLEPEQKEMYKKYLVEFMSFKDDEAYDDDHEFTPNELGQITPVQLKRWMCVKVFGDPDPGADDRPTEGHSSSLEYYKKAISYFMPNRLALWNVFTNTGNPTRSMDVNDLIKAVKKFEVRKQGKPSSAKRPLVEEEFEQAIDIMESHDDKKKGMAMSGLNRFQYHMIGRVDDTCKFLVEDLKPNSQHNDTLLARMCWSKNVMDERDAPDQLVVGAMNRKYCPLIGLGTHYLETWLESSDNIDNRFVFGFGGEQDPEKNKKIASDFIRENVYKSNMFCLIGNGPVGTHSALPGCTLGFLENPIKKVEVVITGDEGEVYIDEIGSEDDNNGDSGDQIGDRADQQQRRTRRRLESNEIRALLSQVASSP